MVGIRDFGSEANIFEPNQITNDRRYNDQYTLISRNL